MPPFLYRCPNTRLLVQGLVEEERPTDGRQEIAVCCLACGQTHFVKPWAEASPASEED